MPNFDKKRMECSYCTYWTTAKSSYYRHLQDKHYVECALKKQKERNYRCGECSAAYANKKNLVAHQRKFVHKADDDDPEDDGADGDYACPVDACNLRFKRRHHFLFHLKAKHHITRPVDKAYRCLEEACSDQPGFADVKDLVEHLDEIHEIKISTTQWDFNHSQDFDEWRSTQEASSNTRFVFHSSWVKADGTVNASYRCHRSGVYRPAVAGEVRKRRLKSQGSVKIGQPCPAKLHTTTTRDGKIHANAVLDHYGHGAPVVPAATARRRVTTRLRETRRLSASLNELLNSRRFPEKSLKNVADNLRQCIAELSSDPEGPADVTVEVETNKPEELNLCFPQEPPVKRTRKRTKKSPPEQTLELVPVENSNHMLGGHQLEHTFILCNLEPTKPVEVVLPS